MLFGATRLHQCGGFDHGISVRAPKVLHTSTTTNAGEQLRSMAIKYLKKQGYFDF